MRSVQPPVVPGRIFGLRAWRRAERRGHPRLDALVQTQAWPPHGEPLKARCACSDHTAPDHDCSCGIYAWHPMRDHADLVFPGRRWRGGSVAGIIEAWGEVEIHAEGFRAQYARPRWLLLPARADAETRVQVDTLAAEYAADVLPLSDAEELYRWCRHHDLGLAPAVVADLLGDPALGADADADDRRPRPSTVPRAPAPPTSWVRARRALCRARALAAAAVCAGADRAASALVFVLVILVYGVPLGLVVAGLLRADHTPAPTPADRALRIVDQRILAGESGALYIAVVENRGRRAAVDVVPVGEFEEGSGESLAEPSDAADVYQSATIPPGGRGVVIDRLDVDAGVARSVRRYAVRMRANGGFVPAGSPPARVGDVRLDHRRCLAWATVVGRRRLRRVDLELVLRDQRGRMVGYWDGVAGPVRRGASRQVVTRIPPEGCGARVRATAYPWWSEVELESPDGRPA